MTRLGRVLHPSQWRRRPNILGWIFAVVVVGIVLLDVARFLGIVGTRPAILSYAVGFALAVFAAWVGIQLFAVHKSGIVGCGFMGATFVAALLLAPWDIADGYILGTLGSFAWAGWWLLSKPTKNALDRDIEAMQDAIDRDDEPALVAVLGRFTPETDWPAVEAASRWMYDRDRGSIAWRPLFIAIDQRNGYEEAWEVASDAMMARSTDPGPPTALARMYTRNRVPRSDAEETADRVWLSRSDEMLPVDALTLGYAFAKLGNYERRAIDLIHRGLDGGVDDRVTPHLALSIIHGEATPEGRAETRAALREAGIWSLGRVLAYRRETRTFLSASYVDE